MNLQGQGHNGGGGNVPMQNPQVSSYPRNNPTMEPELLRARKFIAEKIYEFLMKKQQARETPAKKILELVRKLEDGLFRSATTKEDYMNLSTLESRLHSLVKRPTLINNNNNNNQQSSHMIPTPGMAQSENSSMIMDNNSDYNNVCDLLDSWRL